MLTPHSALQDSHLQLNHAVEIIGKVQNDLSVRVMASTDFGPEGNIGEFFLGLLTVEPAFVRANARLSDFNAVEAVVDATHRYPEMFYSKEQ